MFPFILEGPPPALYSSQKAAAALYKFKRAKCVQRECNSSAGAFARSAHAIRSQWTASCMLLARFPLTLKDFARNARFRSLIARFKMRAVDLPSRQVASRSVQFWLSLFFKWAEACSFFFKWAEACNLDIGFFLKWAEACSFFFKWAEACSWDLVFYLSERKRAIGT